MNGGDELLHIIRELKSQGQRFEIGKSSQLIKRAIDLVISATALIVLAPVLAVVKLDSRAQVLFRQVRAGARGEPFEMLKAAPAPLEEMVKLDHLYLHRQPVAVERPQAHAANRPRDRQPARALAPGRRRPLTSGPGR